MRWIFDRSRGYSRRSGRNTRWQAPAAGGGRNPVRGRAAVGRAEGAAPVPGLLGAQVAQRAVRDESDVFGSLLSLALAANRSG